MRIAFVGLLPLFLASAVLADTYGPIRSTSNAKVVGMILVATKTYDANVVHVRATAANVNEKNANTAWVFCRDDDGRIPPPDRLDGNIGVRFFEGDLDLATFCPDGNEVEVVIVEHGKPVDVIVNGVEGSITQVTTNNNTDPFCTGEEAPPRQCKVIATGIAPLP